MKQKSILWSMLATIMVAMLSIGFAACDDDDDDDGIVGTWVAYESNIEIAITFNSDNTGMLKVDGSIYGTFTYTMNGQKGSMTYKYKGSYSGGGYEVYTFSIKDSSLYLYDDDGDLIFIFTKQGSSNGTSSNVVGTWSGRDGRETLTLTFKNGGSGSWISQYKDSYSGTETSRGSFTYKMEGNKRGIITLSDHYDSYSGYHTEYLYFEIEGNTMYLYEHYYGDDLEWTLTKQ